MSTTAMSILRIARANWNQLSIVTTIVVTMFVSTATASAEVVGGGPDETIQQAYGPLIPAKAYSGVFTSQADIDYLAFSVAAAGESVHFTVSNTTAVCNSPDDDYCPVYATLMDQNNRQLGGDNSDAGTIATSADAETIDWTFAQPGTYYLLMESNGNLAPGAPTYAVSFAVSGGGSAPGSGAPSSGAPGSGGTPGSGSILTSLKVAHHQHGAKLTATVVLSSAAAQLNAALWTTHRGHRRRVMSSSRQQLAAGKHRLILRLPPAYRRRLARHHHLTVLLTIAVVSGSGSRQTGHTRVVLTP